MLTFTHLRWNSSWVFNQRIKKAKKSTHEIFEFSRGFSISAEFNEVQLMGWIDDEVLIRNQAKGAFKKEN